MSEDHKHIVIEQNDVFFGAVLLCAIRYCLGRQSYMPTLVMDKIRPMLPMLSRQTLLLFCKDIEDAPSLGDSTIDELNWLSFLSAVKADLAKRESE